MNPAFTLRPATADDADVVARLLGELGHPADPADVPSRLAALYADGGAAVVALDRDEPLGLMTLSSHASLHRPGRVAYITALVTTAAARRRGVARTLVDAAKAWARERGCVRIAVTSAERRADAHAFYPACGLPYTGRRFSAELDAPGG